ISRKQIQDQSLAVATKRNYKYDWDNFQSYCKEFEVEYLPAQPVVIENYLTSMVNAELKWATIKRRVASIKYHHQHYGYQLPVISTHFLNGIKRVVKVNSEPYRAIPLKLFNSVLSRETNQEARLAFLLLYYAALRRRELFNLKTSNFKKSNNRYWLHIEYSKSDRFGGGYTKQLPTKLTVFLDKA
ncbi:unnamed protein product, partial [marine sediment metagenome]